VRRGTSPRLRTPSGVVEVLRLLVVISFAGLGYESARSLGLHAHAHVLGPFGGAAVGLIVGSGIGYVAGGIFGRSAASAADRTESALRDVSADTLIAGGFGAIVGALFGAAAGWPLFFIPQIAVAASLFGIVVVLLSYLGFRVGAAKRDDVLAVIAGHTGVSPRRPSGSALTKLVDTSVAIDGRIVDVVRSGFVHGKLVVMRPVLDELHRLAELADPVHSARGRRGLEVLDTLRREPFVDLDVIEDLQPEIVEVDVKLARACLEHDYALLTLDTNLAKAAALTGVAVLNLHALALALRPPVVVGEDVVVHITKSGREPGQGVGYLDDGTMVVVERGKAMVGKDVTVRVTSVVITANGRLVFANLTAAVSAHGVSAHGASATSAGA
jgi:uncharacterized protein YacL